MKNIDFFSVISYLTVTIPFDRAWSQELKNVLLFVSIASYDEISAAQGAKKGPFCMGILATLGLSTEFEPRAEKNIFVDKVVSEYP